MMVDKINIKELFKIKKYRYTEQRGKIYKIFNDNNKHFTVNEIANILKEDDISLSTIYRTLEMFNKIGILKKTKIQNQCLYELKHSTCNKKDFHIHVNCNNCDNILDFDNENVKSRLDAVYFELYKKYNFVLKDMSLVYKCSCSCKEC